MKSFFVEGYGCSLNLSETEQVAGFLKENNFEQIKDFKKADFVIINTCSVKQVTEQRMLSRICFLLEHKKSLSKLIVMGCLASAQNETIQKISKEIIVLGTSLALLCRVLGVKEKEFSPEIIPVKSHELISIISISTGCLGNCAYCSSRLARKNLHSYSVESIKFAFKKALESGSKEIWITSQDLGCYGFDINSSLPELLKELLKNKGNFRIRLGMMNPNHFLKIRKELMQLFSDERLYQFLHLPVQSGSDKVLKAMNRKYSVKDFVSCIEYARKIVPQISISTDIIVGFPGESEQDFKKSLALVKKIRFDVVNVSRFGKRKGTLAEKMPNQLNELEKKERSRYLAEFFDKIALEKNKGLVGREFLCLVSERATNGFNGRTNEYKPVFLKKGFGHLVKAKLVLARAHFFEGEFLCLVE